MRTATVTPPSAIPLTGRLISLFPQCRVRSSATCSMLRRKESAIAEGRPEAADMTFLKEAQPAFLILIPD
ncbi:MAG: hypothetical protein AB2L14_09320 [Candidatus Xenobiia bacterium LiM19]